MESSLLLPDHLPGIKATRTTAGEADTFYLNQQQPSVCLSCRRKLQIVSQRPPGAPAAPWDKAETYSQQELTARASQPSACLHGAVLFGWSWGRMWSVVNTGKVYFQ